MKMDSHLMLKNTPSIVALKTGQEVRNVVMGRLPPSPKMIISGLISMLFLNLGEAKKAHIRFI